MIKDAEHPRAELSVLDRLKQKRGGVPMYAWYSGFALLVGATLAIGFRSKLFRHITCGCCGASRWVLFKHPARW